MKSEMTNDSRLAMPVSPSMGAASKQRCYSPFFEELTVECATTGSFLGG